MEFRDWLIEEQKAGWKAARDEILRHWASLKDQPMMPHPIPPNHKGSTYNQDTIRITGSSHFINSVLAQIKELIRYESPFFNLDVEYREIIDKYERPTGKYVAYIRVRQRKPKDKKRGPGTKLDFSDLGFGS